MLGSIFKVDSPVPKGTFAVRFVIFLAFFEPLQIPVQRLWSTDIQTTYTSTKIVVDAFVLWVIDPKTQLRLSASNLAPRDFAAANSIVADSQRQTSIYAGRTFTTFTARLELKL